MKLLTLSFGFSLFLVYVPLSYSSANDAEHDHHTHSMIRTAELFTEKPELSALKPSSTPAFICPMHTHIVSDKKGTCPICGMDLVQVETKTKSEDKSSPNDINVSGHMQQSLAIKVTTAKRANLSKFVQTVGQVEYDQSQIVHLHARFSGWVEKLTIKSVGDKVTKGQLLYQIYSPDLINAQDDYLLALNTLTQQGKHQGYLSLLKKAQLRLELLGFNQDQIKRLKQTKETQYRVSFYANDNGIVNDLKIREGMYIEPQTEMLSLASLQKVWIIADVFENEQNWLKVGQKAHVSVPAAQLNAIQARIDYIYPELDTITRSLRVRVVLDNPNTALKPNTLAKVALFGRPNPDALVIPQQALIQTGKTNRVIVKQDDNTFKATTVRVGILSQGEAEILSGLNIGDQVVVSGQFLLDSEASLSGSLIRLSQETPQ
ncbi:efflux RND transporter periplasmic adaptor subunit [Parashewanella spongiae]|uniref:Efflux RND transporter periplasmic adaptor subunit n=1 Tax=Parashewanella spongiae TaxID=342950 RepID=A0A3A6U551_9GAMM|nr:efflux RND transporter periplasmic adaptor subunit [Parashewanella spongiae]MCL1078987.1 efflux RND transporter periplasmic adaptor subunit [Parashewanella spongiae]RJY11320.1 efflux RND transporter periplasmic adaptor subunit [Parashewanella spongiae]